MIRAFVAVEIDPVLRQRIARAQEQIRERIGREFRSLGQEVRIQWVRPDSIHLTLKFLGDIDERLIGDIQQALTLAVAAQPQFSVEVGGAGAFPDPRAPRVLWLGLSGHVEALVRLAAEVDQALIALGFPPEAKPYSPHLTLARIKERSREMGKMLTGSGVLAHAAQLGSLDVRAVALMKSDLRPSGAVYTRLVEIPFKGPQRDD